MAKELIDEMEKHYKFIRTTREEIAELRQKKALMKPPLWEEAIGTVDAKKDYIKSKVADIDYRIAVCESDIEYATNMVDILNWRVLYKDD